jgi:hypothetical protein
MTLPLNRHKLLQFHRVTGVLRSLGYNKFDKVMRCRSLELEKHAKLFAQPFPFGRNLTSYLQFPPLVLSKFSRVPGDFGLNSARLSPKLLFVLDRRKI